VFHTVKLLEFMACLLPPAAATAFSAVHVRSTVDLQVGMIFKCHCLKDCGEEVGGQVWMVFFSNLELLTHDAIVIGCHARETAIRPCLLHTAAMCAVCLMALVGCLQVERQFSKYVCLG